MHGGNLKMRALRYEVPSRIAINLYDMNGDIGRVDGGMGFSLANPLLVFEARQSKSDVLEASCELGQEMRDSIKWATSMLKQKYDLGGLTLEIKSSIPEHSGFGSKTATLLSVGHAYGSIYGAEFDFRKLALDLKRGGTSGIGVNIIDEGGFILDGGHSTRYKKEFLPSSAVKNVILAPLLGRYRMPDWDVLIAVPDLERVYGPVEVAAFKKICPVPVQAVERLARITLSQMLPAVYEGDLETFCEGINKIQETPWKRGEIELYGNKVRDLMSYIQENGAKGVGMSSMGPAIYAFGGNLENILKLLNESKNNFRILKLTRPNNEGLKISNTL
jgi:beta-ribofuranosylaminobenzene 5'-phosphate synthase